MTRITVINPNTSAALTATITAAAQTVVGTGVTVSGVNSTVGVPSVESRAENPSPPSDPGADPRKPRLHRCFRHRLLR